MEILLVIFVISILTLAVSAQKWHASYIREKEKEYKNNEIYVMNLKEREEYLESIQGFTNFIRIIFFLSLMGSFLKNIILSFFKTIVIARENLTESRLEKVIKRF